MPWNRRLTIMIVPLLLATLACSLTSQAEPTVPSGFLQQPTVATNPTPSIEADGIIAPSPIPTIAFFATESGCTPRQDWPQLTVAAGDTLSAIAQRTGASVDTLVSANCLNDANSIAVGQQLWVPMVPATATAVLCFNSWFFAFRSGVDPNTFTGLLNCPTQVQVINAAGEDFEGGRMVWYQASVLGEQDVIYVVYNDGSWESFVDTYVTGMPESDPSIVPPADRYQPMRGFGKLWRENDEVRSRLGWAYEPESSFQGRRQQTIGASGIAPGQLGYSIFIDLGARRVVVGLNQSSAANGGKRWYVAGNY